MNSGRDLCKLKFSFCAALPLRDHVITRELRSVIAFVVRRVSSRRADWLPRRHPSNSLCESQSARSTNCHRATALGSAFNGALSLAVAHLRASGRLANGRSTDPPIRIRSRSAVLAEGFQYWRAFIWRSREASGVYPRRRIALRRERRLYSAISIRRGNDVGRDGGRTVIISVGGDRR